MTKTSRVLWKTLFIAALLAILVRPVKALQAEYQIAAGGQHTCVAMTDGRVKCWGSNEYGQLGVAVGPYSAVPVVVAGVTRATAISAGLRHTCVFDGPAVKCWGDNTYGQLGDGTTTQRNTPVTIATSGILIYAGARHTCVFNFSIQCWGSGADGVLGDGTTPVMRLAPGPAVMSGGADTGLARGPMARHTCSILSAVGISCWGYNADGQLGDESKANRATPVSVPGLPSGFFRVGAGERHTCAVVGNFTIRCWGFNGDGELGDGSQTSSTSPVAVSGITGLAGEIVAGQTHTCAIVNGGVQCWGDAADHKLGDFDPAHGNSLVPVPVSALQTDVTHIAAGANHTCALLIDGTAKCWGDNSSGQLGDGTTTSGPPVVVYNLFVTHSVPLVSLQPRSITVTAGQLATFTAETYCSPGPRGEIVWQVLRPGASAFVDIPASSQPPSCSQFASPRSYSLVPGLADDQSQFRAVFTNSEGSVATDPATLTVIPAAGVVPPAIVSHPASLITRAGTVVTWSALATGNPVPSVQWQYSTNGGVTWNDIAGATTTIYSFVAAMGQSTWQFRAVFTNAGGGVATAPVGLSVASDRPFGGDLDGDGRSELTMWRPSSGNWSWLTSSTGYDAAAVDGRQWGNIAYGDVPFLGDVDGDGRADLIVWRLSTGTWYWLTSASGYAVSASGSRQWGNAGLGDVPLVGDIDGDGKVDLIVWRASTGTWFWLTSSSGYSYAAQGQRQWGNLSLGDMPLVGDLDGDGRTDLAVWRASTGTWFWLTSSSGYTSSGSRQWGSAAQLDAPFLRDMDGDGKADLVVWRPTTGTWFWLTSSTGYSYAAQGQKQWGVQGDTPLAADIDGDGRPDLIVWRPSSGNWYWLTSLSGYSYGAAGVKTWGASTGAISFGSRQTTTK